MKKKIKSAIFIICICVCCSACGTMNEAQTTDQSEVNISEAVFRT